MYFAGFVVDVMCLMCDCEPMAVTLRRFGLWPGSPHAPRCAFSIGFLLWIEALLLTAHVSLHASLEAVRFKNGHSVGEVCTFLMILYKYVVTCLVLNSYMNH